jgi:hypothetical protein
MRFLSVFLFLSVFFLLHCLVSGSVSVSVNGVSPDYYSLSDDGRTVRAGSENPLVDVQVTQGSDNEEMPVVPEPSPAPADEYRTYSALDVSEDEDAAAEIDSAEDSATPQPPQQQTEPVPVVDQPGVVTNPSPSSPAPASDSPVEDVDQENTNGLQSCSKGICRNINVYVAPQATVLSSLDADAAPVEAPIRSPAVQAADQLSTGAIVLIVAGSLAAFSLLIGAAAYWYRQRRFVNGVDKAHLNALDTLAKEEIDILP